MANISEREAWGRFIDAMLAARDSARALGLLRSDERWIVIAGMTDRIKDNAEKLFTKSKRQGSSAIVRPGSPIILPPGYSE